MNKKRKKKTLRLLDQSHLLKLANFRVNENLFEDVAFLAALYRPSSLKCIVRGVDAAKAADALSLLLSR